MYTLLLHVGKNGFHFLHSFPHCLGKEGFCYGKNDKEYQSWWKNSGKYRIFLGGTLGFAVLHPWYSPQKLYAFLCSFLKIIIFSSIFIPEPHTLYIEYISYLETWISIFYLLIQQIFTAWESMSILSLIVRESISIASLIVWESMVCTSNPSEGQPEEKSHYTELRLEV